MPVRDLQIEILSTLLYSVLLNLAERRQDLCFLRLCFLPLFLSYTKLQIVILFVVTICRGNYDMMLFSLTTKLVLV